MSENSVNIFSEINNLSTEEQSVSNKIENEEVNQIAEFITLPNGTLVDTRIPQNIVDTIIKRFEAIENGDLVAFRATIGEHAIQDAGDMYRYMGFGIRYFGDIIGVEFDSAWMDDNELYHEASYKLFTAIFPAQKRNKWKFIEKIEIIEIDNSYRASSENFGIKVIIRDYENEILVYHIGTSLLFDNKYFLGGGFYSLNGILTYQ